jgi:class 3 adenylate cyclase
MSGEGAERFPSGTTGSAEPPRPSGNASPATPPRRENPVVAEGGLQAVRWLPVVVLLINLAVFGLLMGYSWVNVRPDLPQADTVSACVFAHVAMTLVLVLTLPAAISMRFLRPIRAWAHGRDGVESGADAGVPPAGIAERGVNAPIALAALSLAAWFTVALLAFAQSLSSVPEISLGVRVHLVLRPLLGGLIAGGVTFFAVGGLCRTRVWPLLLAGIRISGNPRLWSYRVSHRLFGLWALSSLLPLSLIALAVFGRMDDADLLADPVVRRLVFVVLLITSSAAVGGALLAWIVSRCVGGPLRQLEAAMARLRYGDLSSREPVGSPDEIGVLAEGFNLMAQRLSESLAALAARNRELEEALDRVMFLERVKRGLDRFVPETVRQAIAENPEAGLLAKAAKDVTVLFLDIEGYTRLSEELPRQQVNAIVERYFSLFLEPIRAAGGDINETAGDGLMIIFQAEAARDHAAAAVRTALAIHAKTALANRDKREVHPPIQVNIGINSGEADVGATRFAGPAGERWSFTASGPVTNVAARLCQHAVHGQILLGPETARRVADQFALRNLGAVAFKNIAHPVEVWEVDVSQAVLGEGASAAEPKIFTKRS